jgi:hypothetical protein
MPREVEASPDTVTSDVTSTLRSSRRPGVHGSGPDRLSPHRQPTMTSTCEGRDDGWLIPRSASPEHLLSRARGCAGWRVQRFRVLAHRFRAHLGLPARLRRPFGLEDRFSPSPATGRTIRSAQGAFRAGGHPGEMQAQTRRTGQGPFLLRGVGRFPQVVPNMWIRGPRLFHHASCPAQTGQGRAQELDTEGRSARDRYVWSAPAAPPGLLRSGRSAA